MTAIFFFFNDTATTEIYTLSLHDALPIFAQPRRAQGRPPPQPSGPPLHGHAGRGRGPAMALQSRLPGLRPDRKSTRLNSSHANISYAVFCLKKKKQH